MTATGIPISACANGVIFTSTQVQARGELINALAPAPGVTVYVYQHEAGYLPTSSSTQAQVYQDELLSTPLSQPLTTDVNGLVPGYVPAGALVDLVCSGGPLTETQVYVINPATGTGGGGTGTLTKQAILATGLSASDIGADAAGAAAAAQTAAEAASDAHGAAAAAQSAAIAASDAAGAAAAVQSASLQKTANLSDLQSAPTARTNLGLGTAATQPSTAFDAAGAASAAQAASLQKASNLSDVASAATARTNLGLGSAATQPSSAFDAAGAAAAAQAASAPLADPRFIALWAANTAYTAGQQVIGPQGSAYANQLIEAKANFTSGATFSAANWQPPNAGGSGSSTLAGLTDVQDSSPQPGQQLIYNGSKWANGNPGVINPLANGVKADGRMVSGLTTNGTAAISAASATFKTDGTDVGRTVAVFATNSQGIVGQATIASVTDSTHATLSTTIPSASSAAGVIGTDDTSAWQTIITTAYAAGGGVIDAAPLGNAISLLAAAQQSGTVTATGPNAGHSYPYSGQLTLPAVAASSNDTGQVDANPIVELRGGPTPVGQYFSEPLGLVLFSTATSGNVVDVISDPVGLGNGGYGSYSYIEIIMRRVTVRTVYNSAGTGPGGLSLTAACNATLDNVNVDVANYPGGNGHPASTGTASTNGTAIRLPGDNNGATVYWNGQVWGYPKGVEFSECARLLGQINLCGAGLVPGSINRTPGVHGASLEGYLTVRLCGTHIEPMTARAIRGALEVEPAGYALINDASGLLTGDLLVTQGDGRGPNLPVVLGSTSKLSLRTIDSVNAAAGSQSVIDTFTKRTSQAFGGQGMLGTAESNHPWYADGQSASSFGHWLWDTNGAYPLYGVQRALAWVLGQQPYYSRSISATIKTTATANRANVGLCFRVVDNADFLYCAISTISGSNQLVLAKWTSGGGGAAIGTPYTGITFAANTTYTLQVVVQSRPEPGADVQIRVYLNGGATPVITYTLSAAEAAQFLYTGPDGLFAYTGTNQEDAGSRVTNFRVDRVADLPYIKSGTATLTAGSSGSIANTNITANSKIRVFNEAAGGTVGALSVALAPGTGFTINSSSGSDTSTVYYEIVNY